jgi:LAO/AO transport system kinase
LREEPSDLQGWIARTLQGDPVACGRLLTVVETLEEDSDSVMAGLFAHLGHAYRLGLTGPPGAGKSTLCLRLARAYRDEGMKVGIVAVDPTSPVSGGALLGDRIRLSELATDPSVFIRSAASRGSFGGLSLAAGRLADVLDAYGSDIVLLETVGMGQVGDDIRQETSTTVVVLVPESGDGIQVMKAGMLELADILVVNKCDRPGADDLLNQLQKLPQRADRRWQPPVIGTDALRGEGVPHLLAAIREHRAHLERKGFPATGPSPSFWTARFLRLAERALLRDFRHDIAEQGSSLSALAEVREGRRSLAEIIQQVLQRFYERHRS